jgi:hypothetical protein
MAKNETEWRAYARDVCKLRMALIRVVCNSKYQRLLPKKDRQPLSKALDLIDGFRCAAEDEMFRRGGPQETRMWYPSHQYDDQER